MSIRKRSANFQPQKAGRSDGLVMGSHPMPRLHGAAIPDSVKAETNRALKELSDGLGQYQQVFEPLKPFYQLAQKFDTTVHETLERYVTLDFALLSQKPEERLGAIEKVLDYAGDDTEGICRRHHGPEAR